MRRWSPTVVPGLAPTGAAGVVSLRPTPPGSRLSKETLAACALPQTAMIRPRARASEDLFMGLLLDGAILAGMLQDDVAVRVALGRDVFHLRLRQLHRHRAGCRAAGSGD